FSDKTVIGAGIDFNETYSPKEFRVGDVKVGLIAFCESEFGVLTDESEGRGGYAWVNHPSVNGIIARMKETCDVVLVQVHAGIERIEQPLPEWRMRYKELVDAGADAVIGSHPHIVQGSETHAGKPIFYSLGNFSFDKTNADESWRTGLMVSLEFEGARLVSVTPLPVESIDSVVRMQESGALLERLALLSNQLQSPSYMEAVNVHVLRLWHTVYKAYYVNAFNTLDPSRPLLQNVKAVIKFLLGRTKVDSAMLVHNMKIESHRFAILRALALDSQNRPE
ncbi:MAG: CapA family protein, partial [bacterium]|nr:CapA family protein [bacterium]